MTSSRTCLITGANAGIGFAAAAQLAARGHAVLLGCRSVARGDEAAARIRASTPDARVTVLPLDVSSQASIREAAARVERLDALVHNAAYFDIRAKDRALTPEGRELTWATNHLGPALLTELLLPRLLESPSPRVVAVTSKGLVTQPWIAVDLDDPEFASRRFTVPRAYYQSKLAHLAWMLHLAERLRDTPVRVHGVRVTNVKIDLARYEGLSWAERTAYAIKSRFSITPDEMARTYTWLCVDDAPGQSTGGYWDAIDTPVEPSRWARDPAHRAALDALTRRQIA
ncbi:MAG: SDR family NAD(P)-dependent oxidoreductase [Polyangiales bacterium]